MIKYKCKIISFYIITNFGEKKLSQKALPITDPKKSIAWQFVTIVPNKSAQIHRDIIRYISKRKNYAYPAQLIMKYALPVKNTKTNYRKTKTIKFINIATLLAKENRLISPESNRITVCTSASLSAAFIYAKVPIFKLPKCGCIMFGSILGRAGRRRLHTVVMSLLLL